MYVLANFSTMHALSMFSLVRDLPTLAAGGYKSSGNKSSGYSDVGNKLYVIQRRRE
jgi:hypothetical protein